MSEVRSFGKCSLRSAKQTSSMEVVAISRNDAIRQNTPFIISVSIETTPPLIPTLQICTMIALSKNGLKSPTAQTSGMTMRSL